MFVTLNIVKGKNRAVAGRQLDYSFIERDAIHDRHRIRVLGPFDYLYRRFPIVRCLFHLHPALAEVHQDLIDGQPVQPGRKRRLTPKASYFSKELNEDLLRKVFGFRHVAGHSQAEGINPAIMPLIKLLEGAHVALSCSLRQRVIGFRLCLGFGCGHVFVFGANDESSLTPTVDTSRFRVFSKERQPLPQHSQGLARFWSPQRGCDAAL